MTSYHRDADTRRAKLDQEIYALQLRISELKSERNALAPISSLPIDILTLVFKATNNGPSVAGNSAIIFYISWVCRLWREIALHNQSLWNYIDCHRPKFVQLCLDRAPSLQLEFQHLCLEPSLLTRELLDTIMPELKRVSLLSLKGSNPPATIYLEDFASNPAPKLRSLSLAGFQLPEGTRMFTGLPPPLRFLSLSNCSFQWDAPIFGAELTSLRIASPRSPLSLSGFLNVLCLMPRLQTLCLSNAFELVFTSLQPLPEGIAHLPDLTLLKISECSTQICPFILLGLRFTNKTVVVFNLHDISTAVSGFPLVLQALDVCTTDSPWPIDTISIGHGQSSEIHLMSEQHVGSTTTKMSMVCITINPCVVDAAQILHSLRVFKHDNLETVIMNTAFLDIDVTDEIWRETLGDLPSLTKLKLRHGYANSFIDYLAREGRLISQNTPATVSPPLIKEQIRERITFKALKVLEIVRFSELRAKTTFADFLLAMSLRVGCDLKLVAMAFANCYFREFNMVALGGVLRRVHVCSEWGLSADDGFTFPPSSVFP
ncbi:hypothetical protein BDN72DRAFT_203759 [Pluteus cervinus]|uniref:Uncharacterized protein n=1 Tax=Pluteus cervinus TaxID=181527 RepID=A0ACD3AIY0_9AGAR|nr:hypothetical protein BDN72DRAFT_203759 [Pluteus cervinus]